MDARRGRRGRISKRGRPSKRQVAAYKPRPQKSLYDNDSWIKVQHRAQLLSFGGPGISYVQMRTDLATSANPDFTWIDQGEYQPFFPLFQLCEVRGIKMEVTMSNFSSAGVNQAINGAVIYAGPAASVPTAGTPDIARSAGMPLSVAVNLQGQMTSAYWDVNKSLRSAGMPQSTQRNTPYPTDYGYCMYVLIQESGFQQGAVLGSCVMTWFVRLHQRKYVG